MVDIREVENNLMDKLNKKYLGKEYNMDVLPGEITESSSQYIAEIMALYVPGLHGFNVIPIRNGKVLMVSATDEEANTIADILFTIDVLEDDKVKIKNVLCSLKDYLFEQSN